MEKIILLSIALFLISCTVGPDYVQVPMNMPLKFKESKNKSPMVAERSNKLIRWKVTQPQDEYNRGKWWIIFNLKNSSTKLIKQLLTLITITSKHVH
jgi:hypothetical protein